jgi:hypothetical protein
MFIPDPDLFSIPDPDPGSMGQKSAGSGSATLNLTTLALSYPIMCIRIRSLVGLGAGKIFPDPRLVRLFWPKNLYT